MEIHPCPFCGAPEIADPIGSTVVKDDEETVNLEVDHESRPAYTSHWVRCWACGAYGPTGNSEEEAIAGWNQRKAIGTELDAYIEAKEKLAACSWHLHNLEGIEAKARAFKDALEELGELADEVVEVFDAAQEAMSERSATYKRYSRIDDGSPGEDGGKA